MKKLFQYSVLFHKYSVIEGKKEYVDSEIIIEPTFILAKNEKDVQFLATRKIDEQYAKDPDNVEILIKNF